MSSKTPGAGSWLECWLAAVLIGAVPGLVRAEDGPAAPKLTDASEASESSAPRASEKQKLPGALLLATAGEPDLALDAVLQAELEKLGVVELESVPGLDLHATQLALDCVGETVHCLKRVTSRSRAQVLIAPTLQRTPSELVLSLLRFDAKDGTMRRALRRHPGSTVGSGLLDLVPEMLRELFDLPRAEPQVAEATPPEATAPDPFPTVFPPDEPPDRVVPVGPVVLASVGVAMLGGGIAMGVVMKNNQDEYERLSRGVETRSQANAAIDVRDEAETQEVVANLLLAAGGATLVAAGIWLGVELSDDSSTETSTSAFAPVIGPNQAGLVFLHRGDAL